MILDVVGLFQVLLDDPLLDCVDALEVILYIETLFQAFFRRSV